MWAILPCTPFNIKAEHITSLGFNLRKAENVMLIIVFTERNALNASWLFWRHYVNLERENKRLHQTWSGCWMIPKPAWLTTYTHTHKPNLEDSSVQCCYRQHPYRHQLYPAHWGWASMFGVKPLMVLWSNIDLLSLKRRVNRSKLNIWTGRQEFILWPGLSNLDVLCSNQPKRHAAETLKQLTELGWITPPALDPR